MDNINFNEKIGSIPEILSYGTEMLLIGMAAIFSVLIIILFFIKLLEVFLAGSSSEKSTSKATIQAQQEAPVSIQNALNDEIVAVIAAAIATAEAENNGMKFKVVSFRKK